MNNLTSFRDQETKAPNKEEDEKEDVLSLSDFTLYSDEPERNSESSKTHHHRRSSSQPWDFEFSSDPISENMSHAEDIIHCGKLVPYRRQQQQQQQQQPLLDDQILKYLSEDYNSVNLSRRYCDSLPTRSSSTSSARLKRSSRSLDHRKLRRNSSLVMRSEASDFHRSSSKGFGKSEESTGLKTRWYNLMFGSVKHPPEMDLRDMKNRQVRRNAGGGPPATQSERRSSWGHDLLRVLSCKNHPTSVAVSASVHDRPPAATLSHVIIT